MPQTILLIDDSDVGRATYKRFLHQDDRQSYQLIEFDDGPEALDWLQQHEADVILLDYRLPQMDGLEFLRHLHHLHPDAILPVILMTGLGNTAVAVEALNLGAQGYLEKDHITPETLPQLVRSVSQQVQLKRQLSRQQAQQQHVIEMGLQMRLVEREQAERALQESEARLRLAQFASHSGVWDLDLLTHKLFWSPEYYQLYKLDPSVEPNLDNWFSCIHPEDRERVKQENSQILASADAEVRIEFRVISDPIQWFASIGQVLCDEAGVPTRCIGITIDITELKQAQQALHQSHEQLQIINQDLERANQVKTAFLRMMSHELRTPLNPILGMSESLQEEIFGPLNERQTKAVTLIVDNGNHLLTSINNILDLVDLEASRIQLSRRALRIKDLCASSLRDVEPQAAAKSIQLQSQIAPEMPVIQADGERMKQILTQLLENAIKFSKMGETVTLNVQMQAVDSSQASDPRFLQFSIQDRGIGIAPENLNRLFQFFTQMDDRLSRNYEGLGIGLALVQRLVELHGGYVTVESQVGQGSCFTVNIPVCSG